ncbi:uncharacterized protein [Physcomitrium patens]|uniref:SWIM-type domain-containing protein n=2 Tax=Physcomitrium patens TaxID=3218 RepID=A0A7I4A8I4_PHYPA|nr:mitogen-activated protein kinase kinase kinase 1-like isoform X1 [Physcomitrium patens]|eukprot:XP_024387869.1 mitogen-activated protein kinase kinase kinase 1-like isoform X1 [Physcomitrella patens]
MTRSRVKRKAVAELGVLKAQAESDGGPSSSGPVTPKRARKLEAEPPEKRLSRFVRKPSMAVKERIQRAYNHRLYLIDKKMMDSEESLLTGCEFFVLGATGNVYSVKLEKLPSCTCPDARRGNICKHFLFVMLRVLKLPESDTRVWQKALLQTELEDLLKISAINEDIVASQLVRQRFHEITGTNSKSDASPNETQKSIQRDINGDCPVCYEAMAGDDNKPVEPIIFCKSCGNNVHRDCFDRWSGSKRSTGGRVTCIYCRADWLDIGSKNSQNVGIDRGGYVNLASYSEGHVNQDTSLESLYPNSLEWLDSHNR